MSPVQFVKREKLIFKKKYIKEKKKKWGAKLLK